MLYEKSDFISVSASSKTFPLPAFPIFALENGKRFVLIGVKWAVGSLADVFFIMTEPTHEIGHRQTRFSHVDFRAQLGVIATVEVTTAHWPPLSFVRKTSPALSP
jgi:hypothetical protein